MSFTPPTVPANPTPRLVRSDKPAVRRSVRLTFIVDITTACDALEVMTYVTSTEVNKDAIGPAFFKALEPCGSVHGIHATETTFLMSRASGTARTRSPKQAKMKDAK